MPDSLEGMAIFTMPVDKFPLSTGAKTKGGLSLCKTEASGGGWEGPTPWEGLLFMGVPVRSGCKQSFTAAPKTVFSRDFTGELHRKSQPTALAGVVKTQVKCYRRAHRSVQQLELAGSAGSSPRGVCIPGWGCSWTSQPSAELSGRRRVRSGAGADRAGLQLRSALQAGTCPGAAAGLLWHTSRVVPAHPKETSKPEAVPSFHFPGLLRQGTLSIGKWLLLFLREQVPGPSMTFCPSTLPKPPVRRSALGWSLIDQKF